MKKKEIPEKHEYDWLSEAFSLNSELYIGCDNSKEIAEKLNKHLFDLKDLRSDLDSLIDDIE